MKNLRALTRRLVPGTPHQQHNACPCDDCKKDRTKGCNHPHKCALTANTLLINLVQKLNPAVPRQLDNLTLTHRRLQKNRKANINKGDEITFNPSVTTRTTLADCFRVFIPHPPSELPALRQQPRINPPPSITIYTDGSCLNNGLLDEKCGAGLWVEDGHLLNRAIRVPGPLQSNQVGELAAILVATQSAPQEADLTIITDSVYAIRVLNHSLTSEEDSGWTNIPNAPWIKAAAYQLRRRSAPTRFKWVKGHNGTQGNEDVDRLASEGVNKPTADEIDLSVPEHFQANGIKLAKMTQALAYAHIVNLGKLPTPRRVEILLDRIRISIESVNG